MDSGLKLTHKRIYGGGYERVHERHDYRKKYVICDRITYFEIFFDLVLETRV